MPFIELLALAVALAMDAFAVSLATGICLRTPTTTQALRMAGAFGVFQAAMPVAGWILGLAVRSFVEAYAGWIAFALLAFVGGKMAWEGLHAREEENEGCPAKDPTRGAHLLVLALATSIDALAVGLSFAVLGQDIALPAVVIGVVCFVIACLGVRLGCMIGHLTAVSRYAEVLGGVTLLGIGLKMVL